MSDGEYKCARCGADRADEDVAAEMAATLKPAPGPVDELCEDCYQELWPASEVAEFLTARYDESEAAARACPYATWEAAGPPRGGSHIGPSDWYLSGRPESRRAPGGAAIRHVQLAGAQVYIHAGSESVLLAKGLGIHDPDHLCLIHAAAHDPARVLRRIAGLRRIVAAHSGQHECAGHEASQWWPYQGCNVLRELAVEFSDHPRYRAAWAPAVG